MPVRLEITIDEEVYERLERELPPKGISRFINDAVRARLRPGREKLTARIKKELARFRKWFAEYDATVWDRQLESDARAGNLDALLREAQRDHRAGRTKPL